MAGSTYAPPPHRFEAGTPPIAQAVGLGAAVDYLSAHRHGQGRRARAARSPAYALERLQRGRRACASSARPPPRPAAAPISFVVDDVHPHDVGQVLDERGIAVRVGHHCARPVCLRYGVPATTRASFYLYTTPQEIDALVDGLHAASSGSSGRRP